MPFVYRLQKILDFRIRKKEEQLLVVLKAQQAVYEAEERIRQNEAEIQQTIESKRTADFRMMEYYDKYLHHLWDKAEALEAERQRLQAILDEEKQKLVKCEQEVKVLEKHKEKQKDAYLEEEKKQELKQFSEIGVQRFFIHKRETEEDLEAEVQKIIEEAEAEGIE
jgi:flagellar export protein FliJ